MAQAARNKAGRGRRHIGVSPALPARREEGARHRPAASRPEAIKELAGAAGLRFPSFEGAERLKNASQIK